MQQIADISIIDPSGEVDRQEGQRLLRQIEKLIYESGKIVLDLSRVEHIHYRFLSELLPLAAASSLNEGQSGIKLANLSTYTREILKVVGVDRYLETYDSVADAILSFQDFGSPSCAMH